ncbi:5-methyltetrahydropteroyltriglutamate/homocysteine S-methyltransferase [Ammonifex degensii KC4]|uniref:5-methyltetrahydropteroyltriglutamate--homocysteine methyltransferase n=1 Tax=Ammonifex degensii (strain DSM 10501 / KC4) TaxID=429009 RepID=C9RDB6_AMMDK|nr:5-methyltetrahydropteroyltriglutamate--homocysteine S-methyltransferase [Ammonifex degensii]ACX52243.1 5-methyltetrahydropteroyltriglutamate/homocysteine S-methyltransferase [Ammonifex degensii KC4]
MRISNLGYPRIGENRELKWLLEAYWEGKLEEEDFRKRVFQLEENHWRRQLALGVEILPVGDFSLYDHVLDMAFALGLIPQRFEPLEKEGSLKLYFALARGAEGIRACALKKWFDTNYHYLVPEWEKEPRLASNPYLEAFRRAKQALGVSGKPVLLGPFTLMKLSRGYKDWREALESLLSPYAALLEQLVEAGAEWVQIDEPALVLDLERPEIEAVEKVYNYLVENTKVRIMLQTYFGSLSCYPEVMRLPVAGVGLDLVSGRKHNLANLEHYGFPKDKVLGAGLVNGRNVWRTDIKAALELVKYLTSFVSPDRLWLQPSCSLLHLPVSVAGEKGLPPELKNALSFADERLKELRILKEALTRGEETVREEIEEASRARQALDAMPGRVVPAVRRRVSALGEEEFVRSVPFEERQQLQAEKLNLSPLPTTTIGSFPQTPTLRSIRARFRRGEISKQEYREFIRQEIARWIRIQEEIGLDVLVHGEFERSDMVEFFAAKLSGFALTANGWVQSYGSRCVKPPILYGDVWRRESLTVAETSYAQSLTSKPVKGILTGPVTMIKWSFVREDLEEEQIAYQIALALRDEIAELEKEGIRIIQVDEPAFREALPLKKRERPQYLLWSAQAFRLATAGVKPETQIHTHMCYADLEEVLPALEGMDPDVVSVEAARGGAELVEQLGRHGFRRGIGLGVFDVHSPYLPQEEEMERFLSRVLEVFPPDRLWVNPDCGLKTRKEEEAVEALRRMVAAARRLRARLGR